MVSRQTGGRVSVVGARGGLGVYADNRTRPIHRWYPFAEAFSSELIHQALGDAQPDAVVFDPFGGSGTTALAAAELGFDSFFTEANPYLAWLAGVKVNDAAEASRIAGGPSELRRLGQSVAAGKVAKAAPPELDGLNARRGFLPPESLRVAIGALATADDLPEALRELVRLAVAVCLIPASNMIRRTDLRKRRAGDPPPDDLREALSAKLGIIADDLSTLDPSQRRGRAVSLGNDVRQLTGPSKGIDRIITSPPYLNGTNYCRNTKLELLLLGFIDSERGLEDLRARSIAAGINNMSKRRSSPTLSEAVERVASQLDKVAYDVRIPALVRSYFSDMEQSLRRMRDASNDGCTLVLDIGDSRYSGVHVDTPDLLTGIAEGVGWKSVDRKQLRARRSYDGTPLTQDLLYFEALPR